MSDLNNKYKRLKAAGMPEIEGLEYKDTPHRIGQDWTMTATEYDDYNGEDYTYYNMVVLDDQHAEDLITMAWLRWAKPLEIEWPDDSDLVFVRWSNADKRSGEGPTIIDAAIDAAE